MTNSTTPEAGTVCFGTLSGSSCQPNGYDQYGNLLYRTDARGVVTSYGYDGLNRLTNVSYSVGTTGVPATASISFTYGTNASLFNNGRLVSVTDGAGSENYTYGNIGQVAQLQKVMNGSTYTIGYLYNFAGELTQIAYPSSRVVVQNYDAIGRTCAVGTSGSTCTTGTLYAKGFAYNSAFQAVGFQYGNGLGAPSRRSELQDLQADERPTDASEMAKRWFKPHVREEPGKQKPRSCRAQQLARSSAQEKQWLKKVSYRNQ